MFSPEAFHASPTQQPGSDWEQPILATSGRRCLEQFEKFNHAGSWAKMFAALLVGTRGWSSTRCKLTWRLKGTKFSRYYFQLAPLTRRTEGIGFGLLPTVTAMDSTSATAKMKFTQVKEGSMHSVTLNRALTMGLLPTPQAIDGSGKGRKLRLKKDSNRDPNQAGSWRGDLKDYAAMNLLPTPKSSDSNNPGVHGQGGQDLRTVVAMSMNLLPTPTASSDAKGGCTRPNAKRQKDTLAHAMHGMVGETGKTSQLNPRFVAEMMGFPVNWTELPFQVGKEKEL